MYSYELSQVIRKKKKKLSPCEAAIYQIWRPYYLPHLKYSSLQLFLSALFKRFWNLPIKI